MSTSTRLRLALIYTWLGAASTPVLAQLPEPTESSAIVPGAAQAPEPVEAPVHAPVAEPVAQEPAEQPQSVGPLLTVSASEPELKPSAAAQAQEPATPPTQRDVRLQALLGLGVGSRSFYRPIRDGAQVLPASGFPVADVALRARFRPEACLSLTALVHFQTSVGYTVSEPSLFALPTKQHVRSERVELSLAPTLRLGASEHAPSLALPLGFSWSAFVSTLHKQQTPSYSLAGPHVRAELIAPITRTFEFRAGPEFQWLVAIKGSIHADGVAATGIAWGAEAALRARLSDTFALELMYRQSSAFANGLGQRADFKDVARSAVASVAGSL